MLDRLQASLLTRYLVGLVKKLGPVPKALAGHLNVQELLRIAVTAVVSGGGAAAILPAVLAHIDLVVAAPDVAVVTAGIAFLVEVVRRLQHGDQVITLGSGRPARPPV